MSDLHPLLYPNLGGWARIVHRHSCGHDISGAWAPGCDAMSYTWGALGTRRTSVASFQEWKAEEVGRREGRRGEDLAEYATLALRIDPPSVVVDNDSSPTCSVLRIDSANRPGTLIEVNFQGLCTTLHILGTHLTRFRLGAHIMAPADTGRPICAGPRALRAVSNHLVRQVLVLRW